MSTSCKIKIVDSKSEKPVELYMSQDGYPHYIGQKLKLLLDKPKSGRDYLWELLSSGFESEYDPGFGDADFTYTIYPENQKITYQKYKSNEINEL